MGTRAKDLASGESFPLDFTYGVIDKCILRALIGESTLILTIHEMVPRIGRRIAEYGEESENTLAVVPFPANSLTEDTPGNDDTNRS